MKRRLGLLFLSVISLVIILTACNFPIVKQPSGSGISVDDQAKTIVALTVAKITGGEAPQVQETPAAPNATNTQPLTDTTEPTMTPTNTVTPTNTMTSTPEIPRVSVSVDTNCRTGPSTQFDLVGALLVGESAELVGRSSEGNYWIIKNPDAAGNCWLWGQYASVSGPTSTLALYTPPPTPTPLFTWDGTWSVWIGPIAGPFNPYTMTVTTSGENFSGSMVVPSGTVYLNGTMIDGRTTVKGTWTITISTGNFEFISLGSNQFQGNYYSTTNPTLVYAWCGARGGSSQPSPCYKP